MISSREGENKPFIILFELAKLVKFDLSLI